MSCATNATRSKPGSRSASLPAKPPHLTCERLRSALTPQIESTKATGLVFLPGAMTGLILAGVPPLQAVLVQAVVMFLVLGSTATTTVIIALGLLRQIFTPDHRLRPLPRRPEVAPSRKRNNRSAA